jgi:hypothetical protein
VDPGKGLPARADRTAGAEEERPVHVLDHAAVSAEDDT